MPGMAALAEGVFLQQARVGRPKYQGQLSDVVRSPRYATVLGLLLEAKRHHQRGSKVALSTGIGQGDLATYEGMVSRKFLAGIWFLVIQVIE